MLKDLESMKQRAWWTTKIEGKGTASAPVLEELDEIYCYVHQSFFAAGPSEGHYTANTKERHNYLSAWWCSAGLWSVSQRVTFTALARCFDSKLTLSEVALCCSKFFPNTKWYSLLHHTLQILSNIPVERLKIVEELDFFWILEPDKFNCIRSQIYLSKICYTFWREMPVKQTLALSMESLHTQVWKSLLTSWLSRIFSAQTFIHTDSFC